MKPINFKPLILLILTGSVLIQSCKEKTGDEIKVPDFATLRSQFSQPPAEYTTAPFFVWNAEITKEEIDNFLTGFKNAGSSQVFIHPRPGLITEYLSDKWFELFRYTVDKGKELGMNVWIYDENSYPSGFAGGHVPAEMPESYNQGQGLKMTKVETLPDTAEKYFIVLKEENGNYTDITAGVATEKGKPGKYCLFTKTYGGKSDWYGGFSYVDLLYAGVTQKFIDLTMTGYEKYAGSEFGKTVPGTFTDEPQISSPGGIRYTPDLFNEFRNKWGYDLKSNLPSLYEETGDWKRVRHNYTQTLLNMFIERWARPWSEYCEAKGIKFTGHYWEHEWPNMRHGGDNMGMYIYHHVPAIDMLFNQFNDSTPNAQFGNVRAVKELASAANQAGRSRTLSETYGGSGWDLTFTDMKRNGDWEYALGVNLMNQHLTYFSMEGARKYDYPPTFDYHEPWWNNYKYINDHYARLSLALSSGRQINDILVLEPTTSAWLYDSYAKRGPKVGEIGQSFQSFVTKLEKSQVEYDLGSESIIRTLGSVSGGKLVVGNASYSKVVIPPLTENLDRSTVKLLKKFVSAGGTLIAFAQPALVDGKEDKSLSELFGKKNEKVIIIAALEEKIINEYFMDKDISFTLQPGGQLYHHTRTLADGKLVFMVNSDLKGYVTGKLAADGACVVEMNTISGELTGYAFEIQGDKASVSFSLPPAGSLLLWFPEKKGEEFIIPPKTGEFTPINSASPLTAKRDNDNALTIDFCDLTIGNETTKDIHTSGAADKVYKSFGFKNGNPWNSSVQYRTNIVSRDTFGVKTGFTADYHFNVKGKFDYSSFRAVVERPWLWSVSVNGNEVKPEDGKWWLDRSFGVFRIGSFVKAGDNTVTVKASPMKIHSEIEPVYILGDFSVDQAAKGWSISASKALAATGSWKDQGLPFYSWGVTYSKDYTIDSPAGKYQILLPEWLGTVAEVTVDGKKAAIIAFPPYMADITSFLKPGMNKIGVTVTGSLRNLLGPFHNNPPVGLASPGNWRNVKKYPQGSDYRLYDYGLLKDFELLNGK
jgi:hypothetical protein